ncbi:SRPBCC family protein [Prescottella sp. R16]|uniref:SRPBCC family protein n=1 Tax=Prescottella sp. R16 TaxID=3064529 RepID=UPI00272E12D9|nr:SRPBCC family protein [Prescottella sp. R16]
MIRNVHHRMIPADARVVGELLDTLASDDDRLWPCHRWPAMRFTGPLGVGAVGGHGPVRYSCEDYVPGRRVTFRFRRPRGFVGTHGFVVEPVDASRTRLTHRLEIDARGPARIGWPLIWRPLHDALIEDALDRAENAVVPHRHREPRPLSGYVRLLRRCASGRAVHPRRDRSTV